MELLEGPCSTEQHRLPSGVQALRHAVMASWG